MCVAIWALEEHPIYKFILTHNRDEFHSRESCPAHWWKEEPGNILAGRDGKEGGTWLGISATGRLAFVTNIREPLEKNAAVSRGFLPVQFLQSELNPKDHIDQLSSQAMSYNGFNLVVADVHSGEMACYSHSLKLGDTLTHDISRGIHGVSNGVFESNWPKVDRGKRKLKELLERYPNEEIPDKIIIDELLRDGRVFEDSVLPATGVTLERERMLSPLFVSQEQYGTICMTIIAARRDEVVSVYEEYLSGGVWKNHKVEFAMKKLESSLN
ncbi:hypothetical protein SELMODRAFT_404056 [Selaginella moellendorffii]|uniref:Uncharacterized protein n=1 Tax=Selaginella moellendorffii TaxID=88036 RepID=D8QU51_SELML|nr:transport and Golgi organization protein 2 homolog isoform X1 [Selaginella moellendorffii]EFJ35804.1 hypothetical protein SELMODRAFT_404056 [Selaginella moellendorffii]|eukprot:XP_002962341.1 transport and Golgi organization protein 2 homolog isoform X1 [Selaginella moellendorffii]